MSEKTLLPILYFRASAGALGRANRIAVTGKIALPREPARPTIMAKRRAALEFSFAFSDDYFIAR